MGTVTIFILKIHCRSKSGHQSLNNLLQAFANYVSAVRPRLAVSPAGETSLRPHKKHKTRSSARFVSFCDPTENRTLITALRSLCPNRYLPAACLPAGRAGRDDGTVDSLFVTSRRIELRFQA